MAHFQDQYPIGPQLMSPGLKIEHKMILESSRRQITVNCLTSVYSDFLTYRLKLVNECNK